MRPLSYALAAVGFVGFWGAVLWLGSAFEKPDARDAIALSAGVVMLIAMAAHMVGVGIVFAAPRGERLLPALVNGISLGMQATIVALGLMSGPG